MFRYFFYSLIAASVICWPITGHASQNKLMPIKSSIQCQTPQRVVAIGDLHGNLTSSRKALMLAGAIDQNDHWIGRTLIIVQVGDLIDRGENDRSVIDFIDALKKEAKKAGGQLITLLGNHEVMNVMGDYR